MRIEKITGANAHVHMNLAQIYEATFAPLTGVLPNRDGVFSHRTTRADENCFGYLLYYDNLPGGFALFRHTGGLLLVEELFVCPHLRRQRVATSFLALVAQRHAGLWDIRQPEAAGRSRAFGRWWAGKVDPGYTEDVVVDEKWGTVTRQLVRVSSSTAMSLAFPVERGEKHGFSKSQTEQLMLDTDSPEPTHVNTIGAVFRIWPRPGVKDLFSCL